MSFEGEQSPIAPPFNPFNELDHWPEHWNPVLVREIRRGMKSKSFIVTFILLLLGCWLMSIILVGNVSGSLGYVEYGARFCSVFLGLLIIPICFVTPISMFTSSASERSDNTLELVAVTEMGTGKLLSGFIRVGLFQTLVYCSALIPFICFGYMLRGLSLSQLLLAMLVVTLSSWISICWGVTLGACVTTQWVRVALSLLLFFGCMVIGSVTYGLVSMIIFLGDAAWDAASILGLGTCSIFVVLPILAVLFGVASSQFTVVDPLVKPFRVKLDSEGNVERFLRRNDAGVFQDVPHADIKVGWDSTSQSSTS